MQSGDLDSFRFIAADGIGSAAACADRLLDGDVEGEITLLGTASPARPPTVTPIGGITISMECPKPVEGRVLIAMDADTAGAIADDYTPQSGTVTDARGELGENALVELGNILSSRFYEGWHSVLSHDRHLEAPEWGWDDEGSSLAEIEDAEEAVFVEGRISADAGNIWVYGIHPELSIAAVLADSMPEPVVTE